MKNLKFRYAAAENFMCFGPEGIELFFEDYGNIVLVKGLNLDTGSEIEPASNGAGKCFGINTPILMFDGTIKMVQEIKSGDLIMGPDSCSRTVTGVIKGREMLYNIIPKKGDNYIVNESHILTLKNGDRKYKHFRNHFSRVDDHYDISVKDYLQQSNTFKNIMKGYRAKVNFQAQSVKINPYCLGLWLGDGTSSSTSLTNTDSKLIQIWDDFGKSHGLQTTILNKKNLSCKTYLLSKKKRTSPGDDAKQAYFLRMVNKFKLLEIVSFFELFYKRKISIVTIKKWIAATKRWINEGNDLQFPLGEPLKETWHDYKYQNCFLNELKSYDLLNNKHIPMEYKINSFDIRLEVLAGLLDTDGSYSNGGYDFISKFKVLAEDVVFLARSVGLAAYIKPSIKQSQNGTKNLYYRVSINGECSIIPVRLDYKKSSKRIITKNPLHVGIEVHPLGIGDYYGFQVDKDGLFLLGDFTVVHNSSLQDIIAYTLYGKTVKRPKQLDHATVINSITKKKLKTEIQFDDFRIVRNREPNKLRIWKSADHIWDDNTEITKGTMSDTQEEINKIIGLTHTAFCNVAVFDDSNLYCFLEQDSAQKRTFVENLLGLDQYREYHENVKELLKEQKSIVKDLTKEYERSITEIDLCKNRIVKIEQQEVTWQTQRTVEVTQLETKLNKKQQELATTDTGVLLTQYQSAQDRLVELNISIPDIEAKKEKIIVALKEARSKYDLAKNGKDEIQNKIFEHNLSIKQINATLLKSRNLLTELENLNEGQQCPTCHGTISKDNYGNVISHEKNTIDGLSTKLKKETELLQEEKNKFEQRSALLEKLHEYIKDAEHKQTIAESKLLTDRNLLSQLSKVQKPDLESTEKVLESEIVEIRNQLEIKKNELLGVTPYKEILASAIIEKQLAEDTSNTNIELLKNAEKEIPYYEFWVEAFGDKGIRKFVVDGIIPALNSRVAYWLQYLSNSKIQLSFDNELNETIIRNATEAKYHAMSNGEKRKINLAVSQAFAYVMMLNSGSCPSIVFLDEITGGGIDKAGVVGVYNMIFELAKERQIFVTSHNQILIDMLQGCESLLLVKRNDITKLFS